MRKILCCGSRDWTDADTIRLAFAETDQFTEIVHGDCRGADRMCGHEALARGLVVHAHPAQWNKHGRAAGPIRNQEMLDRYVIDEVFAFHADIEQSKGTSDMVRRARKARIPVRIFTGPSPAGTSEEDD